MVLDGVKAPTLGLARMLSDAGATWRDAQEQGAALSQRWITTLVPNPFGA